MTEVILALALSVGSASFLITSTEISRGPRVWISRRKGKFFSWLSRLLGCAYCTATWLAIFATAIYRPRVVHEFFLLDYLVSVFIINGVAMLIVLIIRKALGK